MTNKTKPKAAVQSRLAWPRGLFNARYQATAQGPLDPAVASGAPDAAEDRPPRRTRTTWK
jgi:hypothetical protein